MEAPDVTNNDLEGKQIYMPIVYFPVLGSQQPSLLILLYILYAVLMGPSNNTFDLQLSISTATKALSHREAMFASLTFNSECFQSENQSLLRKLCVLLLISTQVS